MSKINDIKKKLEGFGKYSFGNIVFKSSDWNDFWDGQLKEYNNIKEMMLEKFKINGINLGRVFREVSFEKRLTRQEFYAIFTELLNEKKISRSESKYQERCKKCGKPKPNNQIHSGVCEECIYVKVGKRKNNYTPYRYEQFEED